MRKSFVEKYDFYKFLRDLATLPDSCQTLPYFFKGFKYIDVFFTVYRQNNPLKFTLSLYRKPLTSRTSFSSAILVYNCDLDMLIFDQVLFDSAVTTLEEFFDVYKQQDKTFIEVISNLIDIDMQLERDDC